MYTRYYCQQPFSIRFTSSWLALIDIKKWLFWKTQYEAQFYTIRLFFFAFESSNSSYIRRRDSTARQNLSVIWVFLITIWVTCMFVIQNHKGNVEKVCIFRSFSGRFQRKQTTHRTVVARFPESHPITQLEWQWNGSLAWLLAYDINSNVVYFYDCVRIIFASHQPVHVHGMISRLSVYKTDQNAAVVLFCVLY